MTPTSHARARELFIAALERPPDEREAFLAGACGTDTALRRDVGSLLRFHEESVVGEQSFPRVELGRRDKIAPLRPDAPFRDSHQGSLSSLPPNLLEQIRGRVQLLALFLTIGFAIDPVIYFASFGVASRVGGQMPNEFLQRLPFQWANLGAMTASAILWGVTRYRRVTTPRLLTLGLVYEVIICFVIAFGTIWEYYVVTHVLPLMTWVNAVVILFPVILPGPPRRMLVAAAFAAAMVPLSLLLLDLSNTVPVTVDGYFDAIVQGGFSIALAYMGARVVYGLGREVVRARELGSYRLEERLGQGGMGEVWRARHRMLARPAAIKLIRRDALASDPASAEVAATRFEREAQVIASLQSPHTVELYDFGRTEDGALYYVMELLDGVDLDAFVRRFGPLPAERVVYLLCQACSSLAELHRRGLVHRDIKPANIYLCRRGIEHDVVKVLDFGLVKQLAPAELAKSRALTRTDAVAGTPDYMAPEMAMGNRRGRARRLVRARLRGVLAAHRLRGV